MKIANREVCFSVVEGCATGGLDAEAGAALAAEGHRLIGVGGQLVAVDKNVLPILAPAAAQIHVQAELLRAPEAAQLIGMTRSTIWVKHKAGQVPQPVKVSKRCVRWRRSELMNWMDAGCPTREHWEKRNKKLDGKRI